MSNSLAYRPEIDGLRAIAVLAVVLFHAGLGVPGGFVGVDVFFVISGFLITSLILKELEAGSFSLVTFWERRARRILPAAVVTVLVTLVAGWVILTPFDFDVLAKSALSQVTFAANLFFWRSMNYFTGSAEEQPLLHTWSLAVEEQFYMVVPLVLLVAFRTRLRFSPAWLNALFVAAFAASLALSIALLPTKPTATFYLLPTRAWELLAGSLVAASVVPVISLGSAAREALCAVGLAAIIIPCFLYTKDTAFPGAAALPPCLGTALFIWAGNSQVTPRGRLPLLPALLSSRPVVFVGLISYSLYLWHWPLIAFSHYKALEPLPLSGRVAVVVASALLAVLSWKYIESPFRVRRLGTSRLRLFAWSGAGLATVAATGAAVVAWHGFPFRFSASVQAFDRAKGEGLRSNQTVPALTLDAARAGEVPRFGAPEGRPALLVWGDSHARAIFPAALAAAEARGSAVTVAWTTSTPPLLDYVPDPVTGRFSLRDAAPAFAAAVVNHVRKSGIPHVLLAARWSWYFGAGPDRPSAEPSSSSLSAALLHTVETLRHEGVRVSILREVPAHHAPVPKALIAQATRGTDLAPFVCTKADLKQLNASLDSLTPALESAGARILDLSQSLATPSGDSFLMQRDGEPLYYDEHHLTQAGARSLSPAFLSLLEH